MITIAGASVVLLAVAVWAAFALAPAPPVPTLTPSEDAPALETPAPDAEQSLAATADGQELRLDVPAAAVGLAVLFPAAGGSAESTLAGPVASGLRASGWAVASSDFHGNSWGSPVSTDDTVALIEWAQSSSGLVPTLFVAEGMGASTSIAAMSRTARSVPCWYGAGPLVDLASAAASSPTVSTEISTAWGGVPTPEDNPLAMATTLSIDTTFRLAYGSVSGAAGDDANVLALASVLADNGADVQTVQWEGTTDDLSLLDPADVIAFAEGCLT